MKDDEIIIMIPFDEQVAKRLESGALSSKIYLQLDTVKKIKRAGSILWLSTVLLAHSRLSGRS